MVMGANVFKLDSPKSDTDKEMTTMKRSEKEKAC
ncbi:BnaAnng34730D [Brassica napus]|uniref:(rape) hypothetical protein n=1 Tax=Brassica napus TaxID=3708 RepID=A0A078JYI0_BRANA|nr:unnamed protein product [Brassica napus]CDY70712.1 BnaAnng34730D [Brassica napus]